MHGESAPGTDPTVSYSAATGFADSQISGKQSDLAVNVASPVIGTSPTRPFRPEPARVARKPLGQPHVSPDSETDTAAKPLARDSLSDQLHVTCATINLVAAKDDKTLCDHRADSFWVCDHDGQALARIRPEPLTKKVEHSARRAKIVSN